MQRLLDYATHHPGLSLLLTAAVLAVMIYELRERARGQGAIGPQDAVRLMNQGAALLDVRDAEAFAAGHIRGARHLRYWMDRCGDLEAALGVYAGHHTCRAGRESGYSRRVLQLANADMDP